MEIVIDENYCKGCDICIDVCPKSVYKKSEQLNKKGIYPPRPVNNNECVYCNLCVLQCPDQAIFIEAKE
ncbi:4Fe-4S ferredoxin iron-sulfur binding domain protein [Methanococcus vannielii SB]|uniref:4Fe-4S ferredoxin iron-sulfur binding domain protein n=1 Tax=Methanococcus vannielii (strain ATCC 35089 / DSM 1224 / JCM 13029 / OCM 148 / SB) TaxID=406327 RepID=A6UQX0_METVS|nr:ferredoxin family protein [Methanococcus vannielii]ABR54892.1 4Fe-4S ferredoxin iron-sulfur binding domain protein [Methanococcus vannielii SB]